MDNDMYKTTNDFGQVIEFDIIKSYNYDKIMDKKPTYISRISHFLAFYEHPTHGDESPLIVIDKNAKKAFLSTFYDVPKMDELISENQGYNHAKQH